MIYLLLPLAGKLSLHPLCLLPLFLSLIFAHKWLNGKNGNAPKTYPPSPPKIPILGNLHELGKAPHRSLQAMSRKYGELMLLKLGYKHTLVVSSANGACEIMKTHDMEFSNRPHTSIARRLLYDGKDIAFSNYGEYWRQVKSISVLQLLNKTRVQCFRFIREEETKNMLENVRLSMPLAVNLTKIITTQANNVICRAAFGRKYTIARLLEINTMKLLRRFVELMGVFSIRDFIPWLSWVDSVTGLDKKVDRVAKEFDELLETIVRDHLDRANSRGDNDEPDKWQKTKDLVDVLLEVQRDSSLGFPIDKDTVKALILDMFAAGTDTSSTLMEWTMSELIKHPRVLKELQEEVRTVTGRKDCVDEDDLKKMSYLKAVIKETLRLHPPIPLLVFREARQDAKISGYDIAAKTLVIINAFAVQRDPSSWTEPDNFCPERFLTSSVDFKGQDFELIPFGAGRRLCPGIAFSTLNAELVVANLVYAYDWTLPDGAKGETLDMSESFGLTVRRTNPLLLLATPFRFKE